MHLISPSEADALLAAHVRHAPALVLPLTEARGHILREELRADRPFPPFDRVTMDGIALSSAAWQRGLRVFPRIAVQAAGEPSRTLDPETACIEVMTGAPLPAGADTVVPVEQVAWAGDQATIEGDLAPGQFIHRRGSDAPAGAVLASPGARITPGVVAIAAAVGAHTLRVAQPPRITVVDTGNELVEIGHTPAPHEIRRSNAAALTALLRNAGAGAVQVCHARDTEADLLEALTEALEGSDITLVTGGISRGRFDLVAAVLTELGVRFLFHGLRQNPGKPLAAGLARSGTPVFALPGNPVSALVCCARYVLPFLAAHLGAAPEPTRRARLEPGVPPRPGWTRFELCRFAQDPDGGLRAGRLPMNTSGDVCSLAAAEGFVEVTDETLPTRPCWSLRGGNGFDG